MYKRIIFTLLYENGSFALSRNFRLQRVGDIEWLLNNYCFGNMSSSIDELLILDVTRGERDLHRFCETIKRVVSGCFVPVGVGGGIDSLETVDRLMNAGADKIVLNTALTKEPDLPHEAAELIGAQSIVASVDVRRGEDCEPAIFTHQGLQRSSLHFHHYMKEISNLPVGEIMVTSIDRDGTGQGLDCHLVDNLATEIEQSIILAGGVGHAEHITEGLQQDRVSAVATANLLNFVGDGLENARREVREGGVGLARHGLG